jgi:hypothetical protein
MKIMQVAVVVTSTLAMLFVAPLEVVAASAHGFGAHSSHGAPHFRPVRHRGTYRHWPYYGGYVAVAPYVSDNTITYAPPERVVYVPLRPQALSCHHSKETITVPAEGGGTREITITRC